MSRGINKKVLIAVISVSLLVIVGSILGVIFGSSSFKLKRHLSAANKYMNAEEYKDAIAEFQEALEIDEECVEAYLGVSEAYIEMAEEAIDNDKFEKALKYYDKDIKQLEKGLDNTDDDDIEDEIEEVKKLKGKLPREAAAAATTEEAPAEVEEAAPAEEAPAAEEAAPAEEWNNEWVQAYIKFLKSGGGSSATEAALIYVDDDDIPELVLTDGVEAGGCRIITFHDGDIDILQTNRLNFMFIPYSGILDNADGHMDYYFDYIYEIVDGRWEAIATGEYNGYIDGDEYILTYYWDGSEVTESEYTDMVNSFCDIDYAESYYSLLESDSFISIQELADLLNSY